jgi:orotate phosphoribosyltransferase
VALVDDVISDGASKFESAQPLLDAGLVVRDFVVLLDREMGGADRLREKGFALTSALRMTDVLTHLRGSGRLAPDLHARCLEFLAAYGR